MSLSVSVDDSDPSIKFPGAWVHSQGQSVSGSISPATAGVTGVAFNNTLTSTQANSVMSHTFTGTNVYVYGGFDFTPVGSVGECTLDGAFIPSEGFFTTLLNNDFPTFNGQLLCYFENLPDAPHTLSIQLANMGSHTPTTQGTPNHFWIDQIMYTPGASVDMTAVSSVLVHPNDNSVKYSSGWEPYPGVGTRQSTTQMTQQDGSSVTFTFTGTSMSYYGTILGSSFDLTSSASYSIDGQTPVDIPLSGVTSGNNPDGQPLFRFEHLSPTQHTVTVTFSGDSSISDTVPLGMQYIIFHPVVAADTSSGTPAGGAGNTTPTPNSSLPGSPAQSSNTSSSSPTINPNTNSTLTNSSSQTQANLPSSTSSTTKTGADGLPTPNTDLPAGGSSSHTRLTTPILAGAIVGAVVGLLILLILLLLLRRRRQQQLALTNPVLPFALEPSTFVDKPPVVPPSSSVVPFTLKGDVSPPALSQPTSSQAFSSVKALNAPNGGRPLSDLIVEHADSGLRLPQPEAVEEEQPPPPPPQRRIVDIPPSYAP